MFNVVLRYTDNELLELNEVGIEEGVTRLVIYANEYEYSVIPLVNLKYYDVAPSE